MSCLGSPTVLAEVSRRLNPRVARLIAAGTNPEYDPGRDRDEQYRAHLATSWTGSPGPG